VYVLTSPDIPANWSVGVAGSTITATLSTPIVSSGVRFVWVRVRVP